MDYEGKKWKELSENEQEKLLKTANAIDGRTGNNMVQDGQCIIDLKYPFSVSGRLENGEIVMAFGILFSIARAIIYFNCAVAAANNEDIPKPFSRFRGFLWIGVFLCIVSGLIPSKEIGYAMMAANIVTPNNIEAAGDTATDIIDYIVDSVDKLIEDNENEGD